MIDFAANAERAYEVIVPNVLPELIVNKMENYFMCLIVYAF